MKNTFIILPTQLFHHTKSFWNKYDEIVLVKDQYYINDFIHTIKLNMHLDSCSNYFNNIDHPNKYIVKEVKRNDNFKYYMYHPTDKQMINKYNYSEFLETPAFILEISEFDDFYTNTQLDFYKKMTKKLNILMNNNKPIGNRWSYDDENRYKYPQNFKEDKYIINNTIKPPTTRKIALKNLINFAKYKLSFFRTYQDAIDNETLIGFHSYLSVPLNIGLLTPLDIIKEVMKYDISLNSLEGFIRQLIGWREYIRMHYIINGDVDEWNYLKDMNKKIDATWYNGNTDIEILNWSIKRVIDNAYVPHIERLILLNNFAILLRLKYSDVKKWFINMFVDGYDWTMLNVSMNVNYLSQDRNKKFMTRVYLTNGSYLKKIGLKINRIDEDKIKKLYTKFIIDNKEVLKTDYRVASYIKRLSYSD